MDVTPTSDQLSTTPVPTHTDVTTSSSGASFGQVLGNAANVAGQLAVGVAGASGLGLGPLGSGLASGAASSLTGNDGGLDGTSLVGLLQQQNQIQQEMQVFNSLTNISKTEHDTRMSAIRNLKGD